MKIKILKSIFLVICLLSNSILLAQPGDTDGTPTDNLEGTDPPATIDTFLQVLALVGIFYTWSIFSKSRYNLLEDNL